MARMNGNIAGSVRAQVTTSCQAVGRHAMAMAGFHVREGRTILGANALVGMFRPVVIDPGGLKIVVTHDFPLSIEQAFLPHAALCPLGSTQRSPVGRVLTPSARVLVSLPIS